MSKGWIGVDLDGTLAHYDRWRGVGHIGPPVEVMVARVKQWLRDGQRVKIFTARVSTRDPDERDVVIGVIEEWCLRHIGHTLEVTCVKDYAMIALWDDRCVPVEVNTGQVRCQNCGG